MSQLDMSGCRKRKRNEKVFKFTNFGERGFPAEYANGNSFHENIKALLEFGQVENGVCGAMPSWSFQLEVRRDPLMHIILFVVEESIELSLDLHCKHCQYTGWDHHLICNKKYHFLMPSSPKVGENCKSTANLEIHKLYQGHKMHGVFHSNGFGHLLCINGSESGSDLAGYHIMDFWDRLCYALGARKVSLNDVAKKKSMDLRLLHSVAYSKPWFGRWAYKFARGSFGVKEEMYHNAIKTIRNIPLSLLLVQYQQSIGCIRPDIQIIMSRYQVLSGQSLFTLGDLFHFMFELKLQLIKENNINANSHNYPSIMADSSCRWSAKRVEMAIRVVVEALKRAEFRWVSRQHVRDVARAYIGDTGLLDFVLKSLGNHLVGKYFVRRCLNPVTKVLEYCLEDISWHHSFEHNIESKSKVSQNLHHKISWAQIMKDIFYINKNILLEQNKVHNSEILTTIHLMSRIILDTKYFYKEYLGEITPVVDDHPLNKQKIYCAVVLEDEHSNKITKTPYHCFMLSQSATFDELKIEVEKMFRETYWGLREFFASSSIESLKPQGLDLVFNITKPGGKIAFKGDRPFIMKDYLSTEMIVDCMCGTKDDDGERMVCCDICEVWLHTRCAQVPNTDEIPNIFVCDNCEQKILHFPNFQ